MNKARKNKLKDIMNELETLYARLDDIRGLEEDAMMNVPESLQETVHRRDETHVAGDRLDYHGGDPAPVLREGGLDRRKVVVWRYQGVGDGAGRHAQRRGRAHGKYAAAALDEHRVRVAMVAPVELQHEAAARNAACKPYRGHHGLGAA